MSWPWPRKPNHMMPIRPLLMRNAGSGHRYWRVFVTQNAGHATNTQIDEVEFHATVGGADITGSGTPIDGGSGALIGGTTVAGAFDNDNNAGWGRSSATNVWIGYDFGSPVSVAEFLIRSDNTAFNTAPQSFSLDWSDDGSTWTTVDSYTAYGWLVSQNRTYPESVASGYHRIWRLFCTDNDGGTSFVGIGEIEFRATSGGADQTASVGSNTGSSSGRILGSSIGNAGNEGYRAFDDGTTSWWAASGTTNQWVAFVFPTPVTVQQAALSAAASNLTRQVKNGKIEWSDNESAWTTAGTFSKTGWTASEQILVTVTP